MAAMETTPGEKSITAETVSALAILTRIEISPERALTLAHDFNDILGYVDQIKELTGTTLATKKAGAHANIFREDVSPHEPGIYTEDLLAAAPSRQGQYLKVKKILEN